MPEVSPNDEFANFEMWKYLIGTSTEAKSATGSYIRQAYGVGQELQAKLGVNPFKYGIEAGTDFHSGITSTEPSNYPGSHGNQDNDPAHGDYRHHIGQRRAPDRARVRVGSPVSGLRKTLANPSLRLSNGKKPSGLRAVRIKVRMFAGWNYPKDMTQKADWVKAAYDGGVPMGGDLTPKAGSAVPTFVVHALKDPNSGNLDRVQIIKISTKNGKSQEKVYDVVWSGDRKPDAKTGKVPGCRQYG